MVYKYKSFWIHSNCGAGRIGFDALASEDKNTQHTNNDFKNARPPQYLMPYLPTDKKLSINILFIYIITFNKENLKVS